MNNTQASDSNKLRVLALAALGIVYGDLGTSPLYALREVFSGERHPVPITPDNVLGILSVVFWSLMLVVTLKYVFLVMRADNNGEGGIMALMALALNNIPDGPKRKLIIGLGLFGASLFYGDGVITPAISVLSAVEGLEVITSSFKPFVVPISIAVLSMLFIIQRKGTAKVGRLFGPIMLVWFVSIAILGLINIVSFPSVISALNPFWAISFLAHNPSLGFLSLGAVVLCLTGTEALYADMGHFGRKPIQMAWYFLVLPSLIINYFGQGALLLRDPTTIENPFFLLAPSWALSPLLILATIATIIASQAVISGVFSMTQQAVQLGYSPRFEVLHTSDSEIGQIYIPAINWLLMVLVIALILGFQSSANLAAAYGIAVTGTMFITSVLGFNVLHNQRQWKLWPALILIIPFALIDLSFFSANAIKLLDGGWFPILFGIFIFYLLATWKRGRRLLAEKLGEYPIDLKSFIASIALGGTQRVEGTAVYLTGHPEGVPFVMLHSLKHYKVLHERMIIVTIVIEEIPYVSHEKRIELVDLGEAFWRLKIHFGFKDVTDLPAALTSCSRFGLEFDMMETSFFMGRETLIPQRSKDMSYWRVLLFTAMFRNAGSLSTILRIPPNRVIELGTQIVL